VAGLSRATFALLQLLTSDDLQAALRLMGRDVLELARYLVGDRPVVVGGLEARPLSTGVEVQPGVLLQPYAGVISAPRPDDSSFVLGRLGDPAAVAIPALGVNTWYLIEARAGELDSFGERLVHNQTLDTETPKQVLTRREASMVLRARAGTASAMPAQVGGWLPIAAVLRRTSGAVLAGDVYDLRPLLNRPPAAGGELSEAFVRQDYVVHWRTLKFSIDVELVDRFGQRLSAKADKVDVPTLHEPGYTPVANAWRYLYLCNPGEGEAPATATGKGVLVVSGTKPIAQGSRIPSAAIALPAPWSPTLRATCVGAIYSALLDPMAQSCVRGRHFAGGAVASQTGPIPAEMFPGNARRVTFRARYNAADGDDKAVRIYSPALATFDSAQVNFYGAAALNGQTNVLEFDMFVQGINVADTKLDLTEVRPMTLPKEYVALIRSEF